MNVDEELTQQTTPTMPSSSTQQASQLNAEITQRGDRAMKRREETAMNHRGEVFKQSKPTIPEQIHHINPPRSFAPIKPESFNIATDEEMPPAPKAKPKAKASASSSISIKQFSSTARYRSYGYINQVQAKEHHLKHKLNQEREGKAGVLRDPKVLKQELKE